MTAALAVQPRDGELAQLIARGARLRRKNPKKGAFVLEHDLPWSGTQMGSIHLEMLEGFCGARFRFPGAPSALARPWHDASQAVHAAGDHATESGRRRSPSKRESAAARSATWAGTRSWFCGRKVRPAVNWVGSRASWAMVPPRTARVRVPLPTRPSGSFQREPVHIVMLILRG